ncbi:MAG: hypothetical protein QOK40_2498 [Miltoncostaeaceae bacterium]|nr:hypothetical protein [Miltoncostaeaceae bacterium]
MGRSRTAGRPDLAAGAQPRVRAPAMLVAGGADVGATRRFQELGSTPRGGRMAEAQERGATRVEASRPSFVVGPPEVSEPRRRVSVHLLPPPRRAQVLQQLQPLERLLLSRVCCDCADLAAAARTLGLTQEDAARLWRRLDELILAVTP